MDRIEKQNDELVELGVATVETKGLPVKPHIDSVGDHISAGMSHD